MKERLCADITDAIQMANKAMEVADRAMENNHDSVPQSEFNRVCPECESEIVGNRCNCKELEII